LGFERPAGAPNDEAKDTQSRNKTRSPNQNLTEPPP